jgi:hypothetical protein
MPAASKGSINGIVPERETSWQSSSEKRTKRALGQIVAFEPAACQVRVTLSPGSLQMGVTSKEISCGWDGGVAGRGVSAGKGFEGMLIVGVVVGVAVGVVVGVAVGVAFGGVVATDAGSSDSLSPVSCGGGWLTWFSLGGTVGPGSDKTVIARWLLPPLPDVREAAGGAGGLVDSLPVLVPMQAAEENRIHTRKKNFMISVGRRLTKW